MIHNLEHTQSHIDSIARQEQKVLDDRSFSERAGDAVAGFAGSLPFVLVHTLLVLTWILINSTGVGRIPRFDPFPFSLLAMVVAVEAVILSSFILMRQNRMTRRAERRDHLNLQVDLISEKEITKLLQLVRALCSHMGLNQLADEKEATEFSQPTSVESLTKRLDDTLPNP